MREKGEEQLEEDWKKGSTEFEGLIEVIKYIFNCHTFFTLSPQTILCLNGMNRQAKKRPHRIQKLIQNFNVMNEASWLVGVFVHIKNILTRAPYT